MGKYDNLSDQELLKSLLKVSPETLEELSEADKADARLLAYNFQEMERVESESEPD